MRWSTAFVIIVVATLFTAVMVFAPEAVAQQVLTGLGVLAFLAFMGWLLIFG